MCTSCQPHTHSTAQDLLTCQRESSGPGHGVEATGSCSSGTRQDRTDRYTRVHHHSTWVPSWLSRVEDGYKAQQLLLLRFLCPTHTLTYLNVGRSTPPSRLVTRRLNWGASRTRGWVRAGLTVGRSIPAGGNLVTCWWWSAAVGEGWSHAAGEPDVVDDAAAPSESLSASCLPAARTVSMSVSEGNMPHWRAMAAAVRALSPVSMRTAIPAGVCNAARG